jgi:hypothetical protein
MQGRKFQLKTNICANFQENMDYQDSGDMLVFDAVTPYNLVIMQIL